MKKIIWSFLSLYIFTCLSYGIFQLRILDGLSLGTLKTAFTDRQYPWQKNKKSQDFIPIQSVEETPAAEISIANVSNIG